MGKLLDHDGNAQFLQRGNFRRNQAKDRAIAIGLLKIIRAKSRCCIHLVSEIEIAALLENFPLLRSAKFAQHRRGFIAGHGLAADRHDVAVFPNLGRLSFADVQIGGLLLHNHIQKLIEVCHYFIFRISSCVLRQLACSPTRVCISRFCSARAYASSALINPRS